MATISVAWSCLVIYETAPFRVIVCRGEMMMVFEKARAKINLTLDVIDKRSDGYHEVEMTMQTIDLCDYISISKNKNPGIEIRSNALYMPTDERNLAYRAADLLASRAGIVPHIVIDIDKRIPISAGLGGGSTDAAAVMRGLNKFWNLGLTAQQLREIGAQIGSDVPFCVTGGTAIARGRGEVIEEVGESPALWTVLAKPPIAVSTADVYGNLRVDQIKSHPRAKLMIDALAHHSMQGVADAAGNVLEPVTMGLYPEVAKVKDHMQRLGAQVVLMSGSGPTVFGLFEREQRAKRVYTTMRSLFKEVFLCQTC